MGKYTCRECAGDSGWHYDDPDKPTRCPNYVMTKNHEAALTLTKQQNEKAFKAACEIVKDFAQSHMEFSANATRQAMQAAQIPGPTVGRAFTAMHDEGVIEHTGRTEPSRDPATKKHPIGVWRSLTHPAYIAVTRSAAGLLTGQAS